MAKSSSRPCGTLSNTAPLRKGDYVRVDNTGAVWPASPSQANAIVLSVRDSNQVELAMLSAEQLLRMRASAKRAAAAATRRRQRLLSSRQASLPARAEPSRIEPREVSLPPVSEMAGMLEAIARSNYRTPEAVALLAFAGYSLARIADPSAMEETARPEPEQPKSSLPANAKLYHPEQPRRRIWRKKQP